MTKSELIKSLESGKFTITAEIEAPKGINTEKIIQNAQLLKGYVTAINVTDCPLGNVMMNSLVPCYLIQEKVGVEAVLQMTCRDRNRIGIQADFLGAAALGIKNILALTGDHPRLGDHPQAKPVFDLDSVQLTMLIKKLNEGFDFNGHKLEGTPKFHIGVAATPGADPLELEIIKLEKKMEAGAEFVQTQAVYDINILNEFMDAVSHLSTKVLVGVVPLKSAGMAKYMNKHVPGIKIPEDIIKRMEKAGEPIKEGNTIAAEFLKAVKGSKAHGAHIMAVGTQQYVPTIIKQAGLI